MLAMTNHVGAIGYEAGRLFSGTGGSFVGYRAGYNCTASSGCVAIGASADITGTGLTSAIAIGNGALVSCTVASSQPCIAIGHSAVCTSPNSCVLGRPPPASSGIYAPIVTEWGAHQYYWNKVNVGGGSNIDMRNSTYAPYFNGGWIAFETLTTNITVTLPTYAELFALIPNLQDGATCTFILSNYSGSPWVNINAAEASVKWYSYVSAGIADLWGGTLRIVYMRYNANGPIIEFFS